METFPWPVALGVSGVSIGGLLSVLVWLIRKYNPRDFVARADHEAIVASKDSEILRMNDARKDAVHALEVSENGRSEERTTTRSAVEGNRAIEYVFTELLSPKRGANDVK